MVADLLPELRQTARSLRRRPGFTAVVVVTLALGIGATATLFSVVRGVLLQPLPLPEPQSVVRILGTGDGQYDTISYPNFLDYRRQARSFASLAAYDEWQPFLIGNGVAERLRAASVNASFFDVLGVRPAAGRFFVAAEDTPGSATSVVLSYGLWQRRFGGGRDVVGRAIVLSGKTYQVVGIAPATLEDPQLSGPELGGAPELWRVSPGYFADGSSRSGFAFTAIGRLRRGVALASAQAELDGIMASLRRQYPDENHDRGVRLAALQDEIVAPVRTPLLALLGATVLLLLVACANVASLVLSRSLERRGELAVRLALGAGLGGLLRALLLESLLLASVGGGLGLLLAAPATSGLLALAGDQLPRPSLVSTHAALVAFAGLVSLLTGLAVAALPMLRLRGARAGEALAHASTRLTGDAAAHRMRSFVLSAEVALTLVLLVGAGLLVRTLLALRGTDPGFRPTHVLAVQVEPPYPKYQDDARLVALWADMQERLGALPGVRGVGSIDMLPMGGDYNGMAFTVVGRPAPAPGERPSVETRIVTPGFFTAAGVPLVRGRVIDAADTARGVAVVDEAMARRFFPGEDAIGRRITMRKQEWEIVGIVGNTRQFALSRAPEPMLYLPRAVAQPFASAGGYLFLRTAGDPAPLAGAVRADLRLLDPDLVIGDVRPLAAVVTASAARVRLQALLLAAFAAIALLIGGVGIYALVASNVATRSRELAIRAALGAERIRLLRLVVGHGLLPVVLGLLGGLLVALAASRWVASQLYGVRPADPWTFTAAPLLLLALATLAACLPARGAANTDPARVLREE